MLFLASAVSMAGQAAITLVPTITTYAGTGATATTGDGGLATAAAINNPEGIAYDAFGNTYLADYGGNKIRVVNPAGIITTVFGPTGAATTACANPTAATGACGDGGPASAATFNNPTQMQFDKSGNLYIADFTDNRVRKITATNGVITGASIITTVAGTGTGADTGHGGTATAAAINKPHGLVLDAAGNLYIAEQAGACVDRIAAPVTTTSVLTTFAGTCGTAGFGGDGGSAVAAAARLNAPTGLAVDATGNVYIGDYSNGRVRKVTIGTTNTLSTIAGTGSGACAVVAPNAAAPNPVAACGDGAAATAAALNGPTGVYVDVAGNIVIGDAFGARVREIYGPTTPTAALRGTIYTIAGTSQQCNNQAQTVNNASYPGCGDGGPAKTALVSFPILVSVNPQGNVQFVDQYDNKIRQILSNIVFPPTNVGSASASQNVIVQVNTASTISNISVPKDAAGNPEFVIGTITGCTVNGTTSNAVGTQCVIPITFNPAYTGLQSQPLVIVTSNGTFTFALNGVGLGPQAILLPGTLNTIAGTGAATTGTPANGVATASTVNGPTRSTTDVSGNIYIADTKSNVVRIIYNSGASVSALIALENGGVAPTVGNIYTVAGTGTACTTTTAATAPCGDGSLATAATLNAPTDVTLDTTDGNLIISDSGDNRIRLVNASTGVISTVVGTGAAVSTADGSAPTATAIGTPVQTFVDVSGSYYIVSKSDNVIRYVPAGTGAVTTLAGTIGTACATTTAACGDGGQATAALLKSPSGISVDFNGNIYIADTGDNRVRFITKSTGTISSIAGTGTAGFSGDGAAATSAALNAPYSVFVDAAANVWIADSGNAVIREILIGTTPANIYTVAGVGVTPCTPTTGTCGDGGPGNVSAFTTPTGIILDTTGNMLITDSGANKVRKATINPISLAFATTTINNTSTDSPKTAYLQNIGNATLTLAQPTTGTNPSISVPFTEGNTQTCPQLTTTTSTLAAGTQCSYLLSFSPTAAGTYAGQLVETDNSLNATGSTQKINLSGAALLDNPTLTLSTNPNPSTYNQAVTLSSTVTGHGSTPTGTVSFYQVGATQIVNMQATGTSTTATQSLSLPAGTYSVAFVGTASGGLYNGWNSSNGAATNNLWTERYTLQLCASCATTIVNLNGNPGYATDTAALAAFQASPQINNGATPVGNPVTFTLTSAQVVTFGISDNSLADDTGGLSLAVTALTAIGTGNVNASGVATTTTATLPVGSDPVIAIYNGDTNNVSAESPIVTQVVNKDPLSNDTLTASPNPQTFGSTVTLSESVLVAAGDTPPTGTVTFTAPIAGVSTTLGAAAVPFAATTTTTVINGITYTTYTASTTTAALPPGSNTVTGTYTGDMNYAGGALTTTEQINAAAGTSTLTANPSSSTYGTPVILTETITPINGVCPAGPATFLSGGASIGSGAISLTGGKCVATLSTSNLPVGTDVLTATVPASNGFLATATGPVNEVVNKAPVTNPTTPALSDTVTASPNPQTFGQTVTLSFSVLAAAGNAAPTGSVTFTAPINGTTTNLGTAAVPLTSTGTTTVVNGVTYTIYTATTTTTALPQGSNTVTGTYTGDANYAGGPLTAPETINAAASTSTLTASPSPSTYGIPVTLTETITPVNGTCPTGPATFLSNGASIGTGPIALTGGNCIATLVTSNLPVGTDSLTATVPASSGFAATSTGPVSEVINKAPETSATTPALSDTISASPNPQTFGQSVALNFSVLVAAGNAAPTGSVTFTAPINGTTTNLGTAAVPLISTGTTTVVNGVMYTIYTASTATAVLPQGANTVTGTYTGDGNYAGGPLTTAETINAAAATATLTANPSPSTYGTPVTITESINPINGVCPAGPATFLNNGGSIGTGAITFTGGKCVAMLVTSNLPVGTDPLTVTVPASNGFAATTTGPVNELIGKAPETNPTTPALSDTITANPNPQTLGQSVTLSFSILAAAGNAAPTGTVTFSAPISGTTTTLGTAAVGFTSGGTTVVNGVTYTVYTATTTTSVLPTGSNTVTGTYTGDANYAGGPLTTTEQINATTASANLAVGPNPATFGTPVTITETITPVNGVCPAGPATFNSNGTSIGTGAITLTGGQCVATLTTSTLPVGNDAITVTVPADTNFAAITSGPAALVVNKANGADTLASSPNPSTFGQTVTITDTIPTVGGVAPTGTVNFYSYSTLIGTGTVNAQGVATLMTGTLPVGTDSLTGVYQGDANYAQVTSNAVNQTVNPVATTPTLSAGPNPTTFGTLVTISETIPTVNGVAPTGTVTFYNNGVQIGTGTINSQGVASITTTTLPVGTDPITAKYPGDANYAAVNSGPVNVTINKANGADTLAVAPNPATFGSTVTLTDTIPTVGGVAPTGTVTFYNNGTSIGTGTVNAQGVATLTTTTLPVGSNPITASYGGDTNYATVTSNQVNEVVTVTGTTPVLSATPNPTTFGTPVTITESIPGINGVAPTGTVQFYNGTTLLGTGTVTNGVATLTTATLPIGTDPIKAVYSGDSNYATANSGPVNVVINKAAPTDTVAAAPNPAAYGSSVTLTFTVPLVNGVVPTGTVSFYNGTTLLGTGAVNAQGIATLATSALPVGSDTITAQYPGDNTYAAANPTTTEQVNQANGSANLAVGPNPATFGTPVTITETITPVNGVCPAGPATFNSNGTSIGTGAITLTGGQCVATLTTSTLPVGNDAITVTVPADTNFAAITSGPAALVVNKANGADTLASSPNPSTFGQTVTITDTIPTVGGVAPTGTVNFYSYSTLIGTGTVNAQGVATLMTGTLPVGTDSLTGVYQGDANYAQVTSNAVNQTVNPVATTPTLSAGPNPTTFGTLVTISETIPTVNGVAPTGTVTFYNNGVQIGTGTINSQGVASITTTTLPVGTDPITAKYPGDANYAAVNSGPVNVTINKANGADTLAVAPNPATFGSTVTLTDTIPTVGGVAPTGTVTFYNNGTSIGTGTVNAQGVATLTTTTLPVGSNPITASYGGDTNYATVTSNQVNEVVTVTGTTPVLSATPNPTTFGTPVTITESIPGINGVAPTGTVQFYNGTTLLGTGTVTNGVATLTTATLPIGTDPIKAVYSGDSNYATANSGPVNVVINKAAPTDTVAAAPNPAAYGSSVTLTFTVPLVNGVVPTGTVSFYNGTTLLGTGAVNAQGIATLATSALPVGSDTITAQYPGDNTYAAANPTTTELINAAASNATLTVTPNPATFGTPVTITETIAPVNGKCPTGPATFLNNGVSIGTGAITLTGGQCVATLTTSTLPAGTDTITATVPADANFAAINSGPTTVTIAVVNPTSVISYGPQTPVCSVTLVTFTDTVAPVNGVVPTGTVQFYTNLGPLGTPQALVNGVATLTIAVPCGTLSVYGVYTGNSPYGTSRTPTAAVGLADFTIAATPPTQTINPGDTVVYTVSLAGANGLAFNAPVTLTASGLPADATVTFGTTTYVPGVGPTPTSMTIVTSPLHAKVEPSGFGPKIFYGLLLLPLLGVRRIRRKIRSLPRGIVYGLAALMMLGGLGAITGCAGGYFGPAGAQYTITVTGTSGTLVHSTTVTLTVR